MKILRRLIVSSLSAAMLLISVMPAPALSDDVPAVRVGIVTSALAMSPLYIGASKGYFHDEGLDVELVPFPSATEMMVPLAQGRIDVGAGTMSASFYNGVARGLNVRVVAALGNDPPGYGFVKLLVRSALIKSGRYKTIKDLKGLRVAVNTLGASGTVSIDRLLQKAGLTLADVTLVTLPLPQHAIAFQNGSIDVSVIAEPAASKTVSTGAATRVLDGDSWYPNQQVATLFYGSNFLRAHRDVGVKFMRGYIRAVRYYNDALLNGKMAGPTSDDVIRIITQSTPFHDPAVIRAVTPSGVDVNGQLNLDSMRTDLNFYRAHNLIEGQVDVESSVDGEFLAEALKNLGLDKRKR